ncbi:NusA N-terminal domain-containing protein [endosymbiont GvMRE of Glomus versiforme]|uniref:NusA N-terminal domain-containing protein n=1 Tax=endosymbiont GvMRE of Glomus versiforme TaxID=2039283 RepID=UPI000EE848EB|nr:NusA N-terminal domain-containing protein [endosymbiont GvMRE of Glomus versiforme]RHZ37195.1 Transcription termination/antitermination protein NusA [endosymbiont GvMRE of Glomus versiforme]
MNSNNTTYQLIKSLAEREKIAESQVIELFIYAIQETYRQKANDPKELRVTFDEKEKQFLAYQVYRIVEKINDPSQEITSENELFQEKKAQIQEDCLLLPLDLKKITTYEEILPQFRLSLQKSQQKRWYEEFLPLQGKILEGIVQEVYPHYCLVSLLEGKGIGCWNKDEWLSQKAPNVGQQRRFLIKEVKKEGEYAVNLACRDEEFLRKLLEIEIFEIKKREVIVRDILRQPGVISKIIVSSKDPRINAKGTCIGKGGERVRIIKQEMEKERVEFAEWKENRNELIAELLLPTTVLYLCKLQGKKELIVVVSPEQKSLSLASEGKIIQLIEDYLKTKIIVQTPEEIKEQNVVILWTPDKIGWQERTKTYSEKCQYDPRQ